LKKKYLKSKILADVPHSNSSFYDKSIVQELFQLKYSGTFKNGKMDGQGIFYFEVLFMLKDIVQPKKRGV
jgi:hypothetical protein